jgi:site-specific recombinase XerD
MLAGTGNGNDGWSIYEIFKVLGHSNIKSTMRYSHLSQSMLVATADTI